MNYSAKYPNKNETNFANLMPLICLYLKGNVIAINLSIEANTKEINDTKSDIVVTFYTISCNIREDLL